MVDCLQVDAVAYNASKVDEVGSFDDLLNRDDLKGKISLIDDSEKHRGHFVMSTPPQARR